MDFDLLSRSTLSFLSLINPITIRAWSIDEDPMKLPDPAWLIRKRSFAFFISEKKRQERTQCLPPIWSRLPYQLSYARAWGARLILDLFASSINGNSAAPICSFLWPHWSLISNSFFFDHSYHWSHSSSVWCPLLLLHIPFHGLFLCFSATFW